MSIPIDAEDTNGQGNDIPCRRTPLWKRAVPFLVAGGILTYLFVHINMKQSLAAFLSADISLYIPWLIVFIIASFLLDTQNLAAVLKRFHHAVAFRDVLAVRGVTYLLMTIDYSLGLGALVYYMKHDFNIPVMRSTGVMLFFNTITQLSLVIMAIIGLLLLPSVSPLLKNFLLVSICFVGIVAASIAALKKLPPRGYLHKFKNLNLVRVFHEASWGSYFVLLFWRSVYYSIFIAFFYVAVRAFHMPVPLVALMAYVPIILLVISMPITPCGFGTAQAAMIYLFKDYGTSVSIMAFGLTYSVSVLVLRSIIGLCFANNITGLAQGEHVQ